MKSVYKNVKTVFFLAIDIILVTHFLEAADINKEKLNNIEKKFTTVVSNFNGRIEVAVKDKDGKITNMQIDIVPGESVEVPVGIPPKKGRITWRDVAQYESMIAREEDPYAKWFIENLWRDRINKALTILESRLKAEYPKHYHQINIRVKDVADALGIDPPVGFLTGDEFIKIPDEWGGRVPNVDPNILEKALDRVPDVFMSERPNRSASPFR